MLSLNQVLRVMIIDRMRASLSQVSKKQKYYFSPRGTLPPWVGIRLPAQGRPTGTRLSVGGRMAEGWEIKEKVEETRLKRASKWSIVKKLRTNVVSYNISYAYRQVSFKPAVTSAAPKLRA
jgi:hypothetical protein